MRGYGQTSLGTKGVGFFLLSPTSIANDAVGGDRALILTSSSYAGDVLQGFDVTSGTGIVFGNMSRMPYSTSALTSATGPRFRIAAIGFRIRYTGKLMDRGGSMILVRHPDNEDLTNMTYDQIVGLNNSVRVPVTDRWSTVNWLPVNAHDQAFDKYTTGLSKHSLGAFIAGPVPGATFDIEIMAFHEYIGSSLMTTPSHSDSTGIAAIRNSLPTTIIANADSYTATVYNAMQAFLAGGATVATVNALPYISSGARVLQNIAAASGYRNHMRLELSLIHI